jgi:2,3-bisphosphoglycerate-independent phosphoglycerate mutase
MKSVKPLKLLLRACFGSIDGYGNLAVKNVHDNDTPYLTEIIDGIEIDRVRFNATMNKDELEIVMEGSDLSDQVTPNYSDRINVVKQIVHKSPEAKFTSSILNKFIRKTNKILSKEPCNREKRNPPNIILIKEIEGIGD